MQQYQRFEEEIGDPPEALPPSGSEGVRF